MRVVLALTVLAALNGCAFPLSEASSAKVITSSAAGSEKTFRNILTAMRVCYPALYTIDSNYYPEAKEGEVMLASASDYGRIELLKMSITQTNDKASVTMVRRSNFPAFDGSLDAWIVGKEGACPYGTKPDPQPPGSAKSAQSYPGR